MNAVVQIIQTESVVECGQLTDAYKPMVHIKEEENPLRYDLTDIARIAFMFNGGQFPASILSPICTKSCTGHVHTL